MGSLVTWSHLITGSPLILTITMSPSPLAVKRRREAERPPVILPPTKSQTENKEKKKGSDSKILDYIYFLVGFIWYSIVSLWKKPSEYQLEARINVTKALYTPSEFIVKIQRTVQNFGTNPPQKITNQERTFRGEIRNVDQQEVYESLEAEIKAKGKDGGSKGYYLATRIGYDKIAIDPEHMIPNQNW